MRKYRETLSYLMRNLLLITLLVTGCVTSRVGERTRLLNKSSKKKPEWIGKIPQDSMYLYTVGVRTGASSLDEGMETAATNAASNIVKVIGVEVEARFEMIATEIKTMIIDEVKLKAKGKVENAIFQEMYYEKREKQGVYGESYDSWDVFILVKYPKNG